ncbi:DNA polymerase [Terriglobus sp.]|uniref:Y-family DNA polymerase n=1 Tax=Terriglobus sp. TaxID=1889013 RepID=UPI003AFF6F43
MPQLLLRLFFSYAASMPPRDIGWMFLDLNSYFAGAEQELQPHLRGLPVVVVPVEAETTCCIAVSSQAKAYGIRTGIGLAEARLLCPHLQVVNARPRLYVELHHRLLDAIQQHVPVEQVMSCDEFAIRLIGRERELECAVELAYAIKQQIRQVGRTLRCSIGLAPNRLLAKVAGDMLKPDGLMVLEKHTLPEALYCLDLSDIPGIGRRMEKRIRAAGITGTRQLCALSRERMSALWGGVLGDRLWLSLRGEDLPELKPQPRQSLSRQHILAPHARSRETARAIAIKLLLSTARKMRRGGFCARAVGLQVGYQNGRAYDAVIRIPPTTDAWSLQAYMAMLYDKSPTLTPSDLAVVLADLRSAEQPGLFHTGTDEPADRVTQAIDGINQRYGLHTVYPGSIHAVRKEAPTRISFGVPPPLEEFNDPADRLLTNARLELSGLL